MSDEPAPEEDPPKDPMPDQADPNDSGVFGAEPDTQPAPVQTDAAVPTVTGILPNNVKVGGEDFTLAVYGLNFTEDTKILFDGGEVLTQFVDASRVTTLVEPSLVSGPSIVPVTVADAADSFNFAFMPEDPSDPNTYPDSESPRGGGPLV